MIFRENKYAVSIYICRERKREREEVFLIIRLKKEDRVVNRVFLLSGATCSSFILTAVLSKHQKDNRFAIKENLIIDLYVDYIFLSFKSEEELSI